MKRVCLTPVALKAVKELKIVKTSPQFGFKEFNRFNRFKEELRKKESRKKVRTKTYAGDNSCVLGLVLLA